MPVPIVPHFFLIVGSLFFSPSFCAVDDVSALGDPGMRRDGLRVAFEAWNFCNEVGKEAPGMGSPRAADCFDVKYPTLSHRVNERNNALGTGQKFPGIDSGALQDVDLYAVEKEKYLGGLCQVEDEVKPWQFWMVMLKNGNFDTKSGLCPKNGQPVSPFSSDKFPCPGLDCMNQPSFVHNYTRLRGTRKAQMVGSFAGSYELDRNVSLYPNNASYFEVTWKKRLKTGSWEFHHVLRTSLLYPWLMLYLRADATSKFSGGYAHETRGMMKVIPESPNFKVRLRLEVEEGGGNKSQFYLLDIGSCWKNNGSECDGNRSTDVTRYSEMIINPETPAWCSLTSLGNCPPYHIFPDDTVVWRNDSQRFPYEAYHVYCAPGNARFLDQPQGQCDPYSNPQAQEIVQLLPHPVWTSYGYPESAGDGWIGDPKMWELDVGALSHRLYFYQDPHTPPAKRRWTSIDVGTEIYVSEKTEVARWTVSDFDVIITSYNNNKSDY